MNSEDHVWTEVFSEKQQRWIHADSCEEAWDNPTLYEKGWGKRMAYCIALSVEGTMDVTKRYVRDATKALPRDKLSEHDLKVLLDNITAIRCASLAPEEQARIMDERDLETAELLSYSTAATVSSGAAVGPRQSGAGEWTRERGEDGEKRND
jgi:peptide-N4-(N-acetyl-beta-glucosaminyl)asparagine amidase